MPHPGLLYLPGWTKVFGSLGVAIAFYMTAKPERKQRVKALLIPVTLTAMLCGITEPLDFTFLFVAPGLFVVHCVLGALGCMVQNALGVVGIFDGGIISMLSWDWLPLWAAHGLQYAISILVGLCFSALWVVVFRFLIVKFDFKTPGREDDDVEVELKSKADYKQMQGGAAASKSVAQSKDDERLVLAENILDLLGGTDNIIDVTNCATRLRVNVKDKGAVAPRGFLQGHRHARLGHSGPVDPGRHRSERSAGPREVREPSVNDRPSKQSALQSQRAPQGRPHR